MRSPRIVHSATRLDDGRVLVAGGSDAADHVVASTELYDPRTGTFSPAGSMHDSRIKHDAILLRDGRVFVAGGAADYGWSEQRRSTELYDPRTGTFARGPAMDEPRFKIRSSLAMLPDGNVAIAAGGKQLEVYDPATASIRSAGTFEDAYHYAAVTAMANGDLLIAGGYTTNDRASDRVWVYRAGR